MAIINPARAVALTTEYINYPITAGISPFGYWYYYTPLDGNNTLLGARISPYRWGTQLPLASGQTYLTMEGTMPLITEAWDGANVKYHGSATEWIGPGTNEITNQEEGDAFFFSHLGAISASDDVFYWDRIYVPLGGTDYDYYQYHAHSPTSYVQYENGRQVMGGDGWIDPGDKAYGYMISVRVKVGATTYTSVMCRIHTPSVGGAHNSHNDVVLPAVNTKNYMPGGILRGIGERYHAFYIAASGGQWEVFTRTYTDASGTFNAQNTLGVYDLADPVFNPSASQQSEYPFRASCGTTFGANIYFPVILNNATSGYDLEIWSFNSLNTITAGSLVRTVCASGSPVKPDAFCANFGTEAFYVLHTDGTTGGVRLWKYDGSVFSDVGIAISNSASDPIRVHGFEFNTEDFKFYCLLSGTTSNTGSYLGPGLYTFQLDDVFTGYVHLDYVAASNSFIERNPLTAGYLKYTQVDGTLSRINAIEPQAIAQGINILDYTTPGPSFFNRKSIGFGGKDFYYHSIILNDGRVFSAGQVIGNPGNRSQYDTAGDFLFSLYSADLNQANHFAFGGLGDDYFTGVWQSQTENHIWLTGYTKSELVPKGDILIHGWVRTLTDGANELAWKDLAVDAQGNVYLVGSHVNGYIVVAKYDKNYNIVWQKILGDGITTDNAYSIAVDSNANIYISGDTANAGEGSNDALLIKMTTAGSLVFAKVYGNASSNSGTSLAIVTNSSTQYVVMSVVTGTTSTVLVTDLSGTITEQKSFTNLVINRIRTIQSDLTTGKFLFVGNDGQVTTAAKFGMGQLSSSPMIKWVRTYSGANAQNAYDIVNTDLSGSQSGYVLCGTDGTLNGFMLKVTVDDTGGTYSISKTWAKNIVLSDGLMIDATRGLFSLAATPYTETTKYVYAVGCTNIGNITGMGMEEGLVTSWDAATGSIVWQSVFGHDMNETLLSVANDTTGKNIIVAGWSKSHSNSKDAVFARLWNQGYGHGRFTPEGSSAMPYFYAASSLVVANNTDTLNVITPPSDTSGTLISNSYSPTIDTGLYSNNEFNGAYGPNGVFQFFIAYLDLDLLQDFINSTTFKETRLAGIEENKLPKLVYIDDWNTVGKIWQASTIGDSSADDGNMFGYDIIEASSGYIYTIGQTSGDVTKTNTGASGVYDYLLVKFDPVTEEMEFYQNGTEKDEETYALTELSNGKIAFTGRTTGTLGDVNAGAYDIFLGIYNPADDTFGYFSIGSGLDDAGINVHDLGNNQLAVVYFSYGSVAGATNNGSQDIGVIKFNYSTNTWGTAYQTGSSTSEIYEQNGKPSALLGNKRIAVTASSSGIFADNAVTYGFLDVCLAILDLDTGVWSKYQVGTSANEIASSLAASGETLLIGGNAGGSFDNDIDAIFVEFDAGFNVTGKTSSIT